MKTIIKLSLLLIYLFSTDTLSAQPYEQVPELNQYVGTWEWVSGSDKFQIVITKQKLLTKNTNDQDYYRDRIVGWHSYTKNGQLVESSTDKSKNIYTTWMDAYDNSTLIGGNRMNDYDKISMFFQDITRVGKVGEAILEVIAGEPSKLRWRLWGRDTVIFEDEPSPPSGWSVPTDLILTKKSTPVPRPPDRIF